jgi:trk system potassium uptake protein TrkH
MGILVFVLIFIPESKDGSAMHLLRAESPGPQVGKIVSKMRATARILYLIYLGMTALLAIILMIFPLIDNEAVFAVSGIDYSGDKIFHALLTAFGCAGTGGFGFIPNSMQYFTPFAQYTVSIALILFGINFTLYYLILIRKIKDVLRSEELRAYSLTVIIAVAFIFVTILINNPVVNFSSQIDYTTEEAFRHSLFQVASIISTAGFSTTDFNVWPMAAKMVLVVCMFMGAMAGSTAGGIKTSRIVISIKGIYIKIRKMINPRFVPKAKFEGKSLEEKTINDVFAFLTLYVFIFIGVLFILCLDPVNGTVVTVSSDASSFFANQASSYQVQHGFFSNFTAVASCLSNIGPGFEAIGPYSSFSGYSGFSKILLTLTMILGRLEILPMLILFNPRTWKRR